MCPFKVPEIRRLLRDRDRAVSNDKTGERRMKNVSRLSILTLVVSCINAPSVGFGQPASLNNNATNSGNCIIVVQGNNNNTSVKGDCSSQQISLYEQIKNKEGERHQTLTQRAEDQRWINNTKRECLSIQYRIRQLLGPSLSGLGSPISSREVALRSANPQDPIMIEFQQSLADKHLGRTRSLDGLLAEARQFQCIG
jgi:hypothetical protein